MRQQLASAFFVGAKICPTRATASAFAALARGLFRLDQATQRTRKAWDELPAYSECAHVQSGLMAWEQQAYGRIKPRSTLGLIGCGAGRDLFALASLGFTVDGLDWSAAAIAEAKAQAAQMCVNARLYCGDAASFVFPRRYYDAFIFSWRTYGYIPDAKQRVAALRLLSEKLNRDGSVILSFVPYTGEGQRFVRLARLIGRATGNPDLPSPGDIFDSRTLMCERFFVRAELEAEARMACFQVTDYQEAPQATVAFLRKQAAS